MKLSGPWLILVWIGLLVWSIRWLFRDAQRRGRRPLATLASFLAYFPIGHLIWLIVRPPLPTAGTTAAQK